MALNCTTAEEVVRTIKDKNVQMVNLRFTDLPGTWQHFSVPPSAVDADAMSDGIGFDGSLIRGFQEVQESDMLVVSARGAVVDVAFGAGELPLWIKLLSYIGAYRDPDR